MGIVDAERLNRFMSEPRWSPDQYEEAEDLMVMLESGLEALLNIKISPVTFTESCTVLDSGLVDTRYHVYAVNVLNGVTIPDGDPLPQGWVIRDHWLRWDTTGLTAPLSFSLLTGLTYGPHTVGRVQGSNSVTLTYRAGLGDEPAIRRKLLSKGADIMNYRHDDTVTVRGLDASEPAPPPSEDWSQKEIDSLSRYRIIDTWR